AQQQVGAAGTQEAGGHDEEDVHRGPSPSDAASSPSARLPDSVRSSPRPSKIMRTRPITIRYTPVSNTVAVVALTLPSTWSWSSYASWFNGPSPKARGTSAVTTARARPAARK